VRNNQDAAVAAATVADDARSALLADLLGQIAGCFPRRETRQCYGQMAGGLLMELDDHNCWTIAEAVGHCGPHRLQHLLSRAVWDDQHVVDTAPAWAVSYLDDRDAVLIVDETADEKSSAGCVGADPGDAGSPARLDHGRMDPAPARYVIRIDGHLGATVLSAFPALAPQHHGAHTVLTGLLDRSALYGVLAEIEALGLDLLELRKLR
jgi:hypothetical protein